MIGDGRLVGPADRGRARLGVAHGMRIPVPSGAAMRSHATYNRGTFRLWLADPADPKAEGREMAMADGVRKLEITTSDGEPIGEITRSSVSLTGIFAYEIDGRMVHLELDVK